MAQTSNPNKTIAINTIYLYLRLIVSLAISLYTSRAILDALGVENYGIYNIVAGFVSMLSLFTGALTSAAQRFITYELGAGNPAKLQRTFSTFTTLLFLFSISIILLAFCFGDRLVSSALNIPADRLNEAIKVFYFSTVAFCISIVTAPYIACVTAHEKINFYAFVCIGDSLLRLLIVYLLYMTTFDRLETYALLILLCGVVNCLFYVIYCTKKFAESLLRIVLDVSILKEIYSFSIWVIFGGSSMVAKEQGVNVLINRFFGVEMNAARGVSMQVFSILNQFANSIATAINPQITKSYASGDLQRSIRLTFVLTKAQGIMLLFITVPLFLEIDYVLALWLKKVPFYAADFAKWSIIVCVTSTLRQTYGALYLATGKVKFLEIVGGIVILLNLPFSFWALKVGAEPVSTMVINVALEICCLLICFGYMKKLLGFPTLLFYKRVILPLVATAIFSYYVAYWVQQKLDDNFVRLVIVSILTSLVTGVLAYLLVFEKTEKMLIREMFKKVLKKV